MQDRELYRPWLFCTACGMCSNAQPLDAHAHIELELHPSQGAHAQSRAAMSTFAKNTLPMAALLTVLTSSQGLLTTASKTNGAYSYNFATVPFLAEITKLLISYNLLKQQQRDNPEQARITKDWKTIMLFPVPSAIYMVHNNVQVRGGSRRAGVPGVAGREAGGCLAAVWLQASEAVPWSAGVGGTADV